MPRFHFSIDDEPNGQDEEGTDLVDVYAARVEAARLAGALLKDAPEMVLARNSWCMTVTDHAGVSLFTIEMSFGGRVADGIDGQLWGSEREAAGSLLGTLLQADNGCS